MSNYKKIFTVNELINKLYEICNLKTAYVFGSTGEPISIELIDRKIAEQPSWYTAERIRKLKALAGEGYYGFDCSNLLKALFWGWNGNKLSNNKYFNYQSNTVPDTNADGLIKICTDISTDMNNIILGEAIWFSGHIGIYAGIINGIKCVIDCTPSLNCVCVNALSRQKWLKHGKLPWIEYPVSSVSSASVNTNKTTFDQKAWIKLVQTELGVIVDGIVGAKTLAATPTLKRGMKCEMVKLIQNKLLANGYALGSYGIDGDFGSATENAVKSYQKTNGCVTDGVISAKGKTWYKLLEI